VSPLLDAVVEVGGPRELALGIVVTEVVPTSNRALHGHDLIEGGDLSPVSKVPGMQLILFVQSGIEPGEGGEILSSKLSTGDLDRDRGFACPGGGKDHVTHELAEPLADVPHLEDAWCSIEEATRGEGGTALPIDLGYVLSPEVVDAILASGD